MVSRAWRAFGLAPDKVDTWKLSKDPLFVDKVREVVGLYVTRRSGRWCPGAGIFPGQALLSLASVLV
jgi:hypothetical protein